MVVSSISSSPLLLEPVRRIPVLFIDRAIIMRVYCNCCGVPAWRSAIPNDYSATTHWGSLIHWENIPARNIRMDKLPPVTMPGSWYLKAHEYYLSPSCFPIAGLFGSVFVGSKVHQLFRGINTSCSASLALQVKIRSECFSNIPVY